MVISAIVTHWPDSTIIQCHGDVDKLFQCRADELVGKRLDENGLTFYSSNEQPLSLEKHPLTRITRTKKAITGVTMGISHPNTDILIWTKVNGYPQFDKHGEIEHIVTAYSASVDDDTNHQENLTKLSKVEDEWQKTFDALEDVITILSPDLTVLKANKAAYTTFKLGDNELIGKHCHDIFHGKQEPCEHCPVWQPEREQGKGFGLVYNERVKRSFEVKSFPVLDDQGKLKLLVHSARDVTQKIKNEEMHGILSAAIEQTSDSIIITDVDGAIQYVNHACSATTGYSRAELTGKNINFLSTTEESLQNLEKTTVKLRKGNSWQGRLTSTKKDGSQFDENATISAITDVDGNITNLLVVKRDLSKEEQLQKQLQQAMKMEAIGTLAGGIAHDFNNILAAMIGYGQIARGKLQKGDPIREDIDQILFAGDRAAQLVKQILTFSRSDAEGLFHPFKIQHIIKEVIKLLRSSFPTTIEIRQKVDNNCPPILADPTQLHQVIMNLCTNARQAIGDTYGSVTIILDEYTIDHPQLIQGSSLLTAGSYARLIVADDGTGMSEEILRRIFDPFFTTKPKHQGTGLGLSVIHGIVERHGGTIKVESVLNEGTTFSLYFPVINENIEAMKELAGPPKRGTERIMVVDDEKPIADLLNLMLSSLGYTVTVYTSSLEAVADFRRHPQNFDAIITDMTMPNMTGAELAREMLSLRPELPIIMATGYNETMDEEKASRIGIRSFLLKPLKKVKIATVLRTVLDNG